MRPCERCFRRRDTCAFLADEAHISVPERYLRDLQRQITQLRATAPTAMGVRPDLRGSVSVSDTEPSVITPPSLDARPVIPPPLAQTAEIATANHFTPTSLSRESIDGMVKPLYTPPYMPEGYCIANAANNR